MAIDWFAAFLFWSLVSALVRYFDPRCEFVGAHLLTAAWLVGWLLLATTLPRRGGS